MKNALKRLLNQREYSEAQLHAIIHDFNFALWYLHEAESTKTFDFDEFLSHLDHLCKEKVINNVYLSELWEKSGLLADIVHYFEMKKKRYVEFA